MKPPPQPEPGPPPDDPGSGSVDPGSGSVDPGSGSVDPGNGSVDPGNGSVDPGSGSVDPGSGAAYRRLVRLASGHGSLVLAFAWAFAEAGLFFIVPDVWLGFVALYAPRRVVATLLAIVAGAVAGAALLFLATPLAGDALSRLLVGLPGIGAGDLVQARAELATQGIAAFLNGPVQGLPVKLYIHAAALEGFGLIEVLVATALNRLERIGIFAVVTVLLGIVFRPLIVRWPRAVATGYALAWVIFYLAFWSGRA